MANVALMTPEEFMALPDDGIERDLIRGEVREYPTTRSPRGGLHCLAMANLTASLHTWKNSQGAPRGRVYAGGMRILVHRDPDTFVGANIVYISSEQATHTPEKAAFLAEPPTVVIEILSPSDKFNDVADKIGDYLDAGIPLVLKVDPFDRSVLAYRPDGALQAFNSTQELTAEPQFPGLRVAVADIFAP